MCARNWCATAAAPNRPIERGIAGPGLAHVLGAKLADHRKRLPSAVCTA